MGINVALFSKSEIIKKMLSHSLHYYVGEVSRFDKFEDLKAQSAAPDIIFIDWDLKGEAEALAHSAQKEMAEVPLVALCRREELKNGAPRHRLQKPLEASALRAMAAELVPKAGKSKIHPFLKFPKNEGARAPGKPLGQPAKAGPFPAAETNSSAAPPAETFSMSAPAEGDESLIIKAEDGPPIEAMEGQNPQAGPPEDGFDMGAPAAGDESLIVKAEDGPPIEAMEGQNPQAGPPEDGFDMGAPAAGDETLIVKAEDGPPIEAPGSQESPSAPSGAAGPPKEDSSNIKAPAGEGKSPGARAEAKAASEKAAGMPAGKSAQAAALNKEDINLDENTQNDFAPMAIKSPSEAKEGGPFDEGIEEPAARISDQDIARVLKDYKDTLKFETLMEKSLDRYGRDMVQKILARDNQDLMRAALSEFQETEAFKKMLLQTLQEYASGRSVFREAFEKTLRDFAERQLPVLAKEIVEREIQKLLKEEDG